MIDRKFRCANKVLMKGGGTRLCQKQGRLCKVTAPGGIPWSKLLCKECQVLCRIDGWDVVQIEKDNAEVSGKSANAAQQ